MNVIDEVLKAEKEAAEKLNEARAKMASRVEELKSEQNEKLSTEVDRLKNEEANEMAGFSKTIDEKVAVIEADTKKQVQDIERKFGDNKSSILSLIKESF